MKILIVLLFAVNLAWSQQTINGSIQHGGLTRTYILYVPASYSSNNSVPLVFNFHGYTSNSAQQMVYGDFRSIADTANFILVHPMGTLDANNQAYWNSGWGGSVDDIGFTSALIDSLSAMYNINPNRVYSTGMSNGGFMSYTLACQLSNRIAAIASVTGTMNANQSTVCNPQHPMPVLEIHGTADPTVPYAGNANMASVASVLNYWKTYNNCSSTAVMTNVPNTSLTDGCTAERYVYTGGNNGVEVEHYKIVDGAHTWPGAPITIAVTNFDIHASSVIWRFFSKYDLNGALGTANINQNELGGFNVFPNPSNGYFEMKGLEHVSELTLYSPTGEAIVCPVEHSKCNVSHLKSGLYFVAIGTNKYKVVKN